MKILETRILRGPNRWSCYRKKLVEIKLDLGELEEFPTNKIPGFSERLEKMLPSLHSHECSEGKPGGFFERVRQGTWMGHVMEHVALELQSLAGMECGYGRTRSADRNGVYYVVYAFEIKEAGLFAGKAAIRLLEALIAGKTYNVDDDLAKLAAIRKEKGFTSFTTTLMELARKRNIPVKTRDNETLLLGYGQKQKRVQLVNGHPVLPSLSTGEQFSILRESSIPVCTGNETVTGKQYQFCLLDGNLLSAVEMNDEEPSLIYLEKVQLEDRIHPSNVFLVERAAKLLALPVCTIGIISPDITEPVTRTGAFVNELIPGPPTNWNSKGEELIASRFLEMMFEEGENGRIPIVSITGTNGKTTTTRLIAHMAATAGHVPGYTNTDGIYIGEECVFNGDCSGPGSAEIILRDPLVDLAVLECARGGILRSGLGFDECDISVITNISGDHLGLEGIHSKKELAKVKAVVAFATSGSGYAVLNAEDDLVYDLKHQVDCQVALFGMRIDDRLRRHMHMGGLVAYVEDDHFVVCWHGCRSVIAGVRETPLTHQGRSECMVRNILPCLCVAMIRNFGIPAIREALETFVPGPKYTPGRMNLFSFPCYDVLVDYAHNPDGYRELLKFLRKTEASRKVGIIACPGDRREEDIASMGWLAAQMFDEIIIRHDRDSRGRTNEDITEMIMMGIRGAEKNIPVRVISDELEALEHAMSGAIEGSIIVTCTEDSGTATGFLQEKLKQKAYQDVMVHSG